MRMSKLIPAILAFGLFVFAAADAVRAQEERPEPGPAAAGGELRGGGSFANLFRFEFYPGKTDEGLEILTETLIPAYKKAGVEVTLIEDLLGTKDIYLIVPLREGPAYYSFTVPQQDAAAWKELIKLTGSAEKAEARLDKLIGYVKRQTQTLIFIRDKK